jgi:hypothetical protein
MVSMFEDMLLRYSNGKARLREHLLQHLDDDSLRNMRLVSRVLHDLMDRYPSRMFGRLFIRISWAHDTDTSSLTAAAPFCRSLTIKLGPGEVNMGQRVRRLLQRRDVLQAISSHISLPPSAEIPGGRGSITTRSTASSKPTSSNLSGVSARHIWINFFSNCQWLRSITISTNGDPGWSGRSQVENDLVDLRVALQSVDLPSLRCLSLAPVHAMGIVHLCWSGFGAFGGPSMNSHNLWSNLHTLDMQLNNPSSAEQKLSEPQQVMFKKVLYDYLQALRPPSYVYDSSGSMMMGQVQSHLTWSLVWKTAVKQSCGSRWRSSIWATLHYHTVLSGFYLSV